MHSIDRDIAELHRAIGPLFDHVQLEREIAMLVKSEFSIDARIDRAVRAHRPRRHLLRAKRLAVAAELAA